MVTRLSLGATFAERRMRDAFWLLYKPVALTWRQRPSYAAELPVPRPPGVCDRASRSTLHPWLGNCSFGMDGPIERIFYARQEHASPLWGCRHRVGDHGGNCPGRVRSVAETHYTGMEKRQGGKGQRVHDGRGDARRAALPKLQRIDGCTHVLTRPERRREVLGLQAVPEMQRYAARRLEFAIGTTSPLSNDDGWNFG